MIRMVVFDMAGTTVDEDNVVYKTLHRALQKKGYDIPLELVLKEGAGKEKLQAIKSILKAGGKKTDNKRTEEIYDDFIGMLASAYKDLEVRPQPNAAELFSILRKRNIRVVLNTGYNAETADALIDKLGWERGIEFDDVITASDVENSRPDPEMIELAMDLFGIESAKEVIKVGDSMTDIEEGQNAGCCLNIGITTGSQSYQQLQSASPDFIINNLLELVPILDRVNASSIAD